MKNYISGILLFAFLYSNSQIKPELTALLTYSVCGPQPVNKNPPLLVLLHGYGSNEKDLMDIAKALDKNILVLSARAPVTLSAGSFCWYHIKFLPNGDFEYDYKETEQSRKKILEFISKACNIYHADSSRVFLLGFSQGAIMSYDILLNKPQKIKGIAALSGRLMRESAQKKTDETALSRTFIFIAHGNSDPRISIKEGSNAMNFFTNKKVTHLAYKTYNMPHSIIPPEVEDIHRWLAEALKNR